MSTATTPREALIARKLIVNPYLSIVQCSSNEILVKHGGRSRFSHVIRDEGRTRLIGKVLRHLRSPASLADLQQQGMLADTEIDDAAALIEYLAGERILVTPDDYLPYVYLSMQHGRSVDHLKTRTIGLMGSGHLGSRIARQLSLLQVRGIVLLDDRCAGPSDRIFFNLGPESVEPGMTYVEITQRALENDGYARTQCIEGSFNDQRALGELFERSDVVIAALEWFSPQALHAANQAALAIRKPWMSLYIDGSEAILGPIYVPGETLCYNEFEIQHEASMSMRDDYLLYKEGLIESAYATDRIVLPPYLSMAEGWAMSALLPFLISGRSFAIGRCMRIDFERISVDYEDVLKLPRCPACKPQQPGYIHTFL